MLLPPVPSRVDGRDAADLHARIAGTDQAERVESAGIRRASTQHQVSFQKPGREPGTDAREWGREQLRELVAGLSMPSIRRCEPGRDPPPVPRPS